MPLRKSIQLEDLRELRPSSIDHFNPPPGLGIPRKLKTVQSQSTNSNEEEDGESWKKVETKNNHILVNQLHYCRFLYYMIKNSQNLLVNEKSKNKLNLVVFKHLLKLIKHLADCNSNWFKLRDWAQFKNSKKYLNTYLTMKEYESRYEKEYLTFLRSAEVSVIREVNKEFGELSNLNAFSLEIYGKLLNFVGPLIREANHNIGANIRVGSEATLSKETIGSMESLKALFKYYSLVQTSVSHF